MREMVFKNLTNQNARKRDVSIQEIVERNGVTSTTMKRSIYFIRGSYHVKSNEELQEWIKRRNKNSELNKKFFHVLRECSDSNKEDKLICKMRGSFYFIAGESVYNIVFVHSIKIKVHKERSK